MVVDLDTDSTASDGVTDGENILSAILAEIIFLFLVAGTILWGWHLV